MEDEEDLGTNWFTIAAMVLVPLGVGVGIGGAAVVVVVAAAVASGGRSSGSGTCITSISAFPFSWPIDFLSPSSVTDLMLLAMKNDVHPDLFATTVLRMGFTSSG